MAGPTADFWQQRFENNDIGWDRGGPNPQLLAWLDSGEVQPCRIPVSRCCTPIFHMNLRYAWCADEFEFILANPMDVD
jgi:hypothetical protein